MIDDGILEPLDAMDQKNPRGLAKRELFITPGMKLTHVPSQTTGIVIRFIEGVEIIIKDQLGTEKTFAPTPGLFRYEGTLVALRAPLTTQAPKATITASGSISAAESQARIARKSRIWVEGIHDAELIERVWGDDLRYEGVVVEQLEGADDLAQRVKAFRPTSKQRLGILVDHLITGTKESRIASEISDPNVLVLGHPYVDIWQAIKPSTIGIAAWPEVPMSENWKEGILKRISYNGEPGQFFRHLLGKVDNWNDLETPLVNSMERLIDFVTCGD